MLNSALGYDKKENGTFFNVKIVSLGSWAVDGLITQCFIYPALVLCCAYFAKLLLSFCSRAGARFLQNYYQTAPIC